MCVIKSQTIPIVVCGIISHKNGEQGVPHFMEHETYLACDMWMYLCYLHYVTALRNNKRDVMYESQLTLRR